MSKVLFVTVGTTYFEELIQTLDCEYFHKLLKVLKFDKVIYQTGRGNHIPKYNSIIKVETFKLTPNITDYFQQADTIITHCGAGTLLECLKLKKRIIAVVNDTLLDNHQEYLYNKLLSNSYLTGYTSPKLILKDIEQLKNKLTSNNQPYEQPQRCLLNDMIIS